MIRQKTKYPGVYYLEGKAIGANKLERIYYIVYRRAGKLIEEKAGRQYQDDMTPARAARIRAARIEGEQLSNMARREAEQVAKAAEAGRWTIVRLWDEYKSQKPVSKSLKSDDGRFSKYIAPSFGEKQPQEIIQLDVDRVRLKLLKKLKPQTVKHILALLRRIVNFGVRKQLCANLAFQIELPQVNNCKTENLSQAQLTNLLLAIEKSTDIQAKDIMLMALYTGMRRGELFKLKWQDIDFERNFILIRDPKGGIDQTIPLNNLARATLLQHPRNSEYVFGRGGGKPFTDIKKRVNLIKKEAGIPDEFRALHGLRHVFASMLASSGQVDMYTIQRLLTHKSPQMTQRYAHLRDEALKRASNLIGDLVHNGNTVLKTEETNGHESSSERLIMTTG